MSFPIPTADTEPFSRVLLVDDEPNVLRALRRSLRGHGFEIHTVPSGAEALALLERQPMDAIVCDMRMPGMNGAEMLASSIRLAPDAVRVLLTGYSDIESAVKAVNQGEIFRYLAKPWDDDYLLHVLRDGLARKSLERERDALLVLTGEQNDRLRALNAGLEDAVASRTAELTQTVAELRALTEQLKTDFTSTVRLLSSLIERRAGLTARCPSQVAKHVRVLGATFGLTGEALNDLIFAALLQDIGKLALPDEAVSHSLEGVDPALLSRVLHHPLAGESLLMALPSLRNAGAILGQVNEHFDGSGVPGNAAGNDIGIGARILRVAADFEHYQAGAIELEALSADRAFRRIRQFRGTRYDPAVADAFLRDNDQPVAGPARKVLVSSDNLRPGMQLAQDLAAPGGTLLLSQGYVLDERVIAHIRRLERFSGDFLWITVTGDDGREVKVGRDVREAA